jgi:hypothetical protein
MDGAVRQREMAARLRLEIREKPHRRRAEHTVRISGDRISAAETTTSTGNHHTAVTDIRNATERSPDASTNGLQHEPDGNDARDSLVFGPSDAVLFMFYLDYLHPFLFPFYRPSILQGDRAWILDMFMSRLVVRQAALCQSSYVYFSHSRNG